MEKEFSIEEILKRAEKLSAKDEFEEALMLLDKLDVEGEQGGLICFVRGNVYAGREQWESAQKWYAESLRKGFVSEKLFMNYGKLRVQLGQRAEAVELFKQAFQLKPTDITPLNNIVQLRLESGNIMGAVATMEQMMDCFPELFDGFHHYADMLLGTNEPERALQFLEKYEQRFSGNSLYVYNKTRALDAVDKTREALDYLYENREKFMNSPMVITYKKQCGNLLFKLGAYEQALPFLLELFDENRDREAGLCLISLSFKKQEYELAFEIADRIMQYPGRGKGYFMAIYYKGLALEMMQKPDLARETYLFFLEELWDIPREELSAEVLSHRFRVEYTLGMNDEAHKTVDAFATLLDKYEGQNSEELAKSRQQIEELRTMLQERADSFC